MKGLQMIAYLELTISGESDECKEILRKLGAKDLYFYEANGVEEHHIAIKITDDMSWNKITDDLTNIGCRVPRITRMASGTDKPNSSNPDILTFTQLFSEA